MLQTYHTDGNAQDLLVTAREMQAMAERHMREYRQLVLELAALYGPTALEQLPQSTRATYQPADWRAFFAALPTPGPSDSVPRTEHQQVQQQLASTRQALHRAQSELGQLRAAAQKKTAPPPAPAAVKKQPAPVPTQTPAPAPKPAPVVPTPPTMPPCRWPVLPAKLPMAISVRPVWQTLALEQLWLIAQGYPLVSEGRHWLTQRHPTEHRLIRDVTAELERADLVQVVRFANVLPQDGAAEALSITAATLTPVGTALCQALRWNGAASELVRLSEAGLDERHLAGGLYLAAYARRRGYAVIVGNQPYLWVDPNWVTLVLDDTPPTDAGTWCVALNSQRCVALCAATPERRARWVAAAQAQGWPGQATDLQTLRQQPEAPLWPTTWTTQKPAAS